jgi:hypothetical protein
MVQFFKNVIMIMMVLHPQSLGLVTTEEEIVGLHGSTKNDSIWHFYGSYLAPVSLGDRPHSRSYFKNLIFLREFKKSIWK